MGRYLFVLVGLLASSAFAAHAPDAAREEMAAALTEEGTSSPRADAERDQRGPSPAQKLRIAADTLMCYLQDEKSMMGEVIKTCLSLSEDQREGGIAYVRWSLAIINQQLSTTKDLQNLAQDLDWGNSNPAEVLYKLLVGRLNYLNDYARDLSTLEQGDAFNPAADCYNGHAMMKHLFLCDLIGKFYQIVSSSRAPYPLGLQEALDASGNLQAYLEGEVDLPIPHECLGQHGQFFKSFTVVELTPTDRFSRKNIKVYEEAFPIHEQQSLPRVLQEKLPTGSRVHLLPYPLEKKDRDRIDLLQKEVHKEQKINRRKKERKKQTEKSATQVALEEAQRRTAFEEQDRLSRAAGQRGPLAVTASTGGRVSLSALEGQQVPRYVPPSIPGKPKTQGLAHADPLMEEEEGGAPVVTHPPITLDPKFQDGLEKLWAKQTGLKYPEVSRTLMDLGIDLDESSGSHVTLFYQQPSGERTYGGLWRQHGSGDGYGSYTLKFLKDFLAKCAFTPENVTFDALEMAAEGR